MTMASNIVVEWLRSLHLGQYSESFIDNGYDDLEICKQIGDPDLDAIGVFNQTHRARLLQSVKTLREEGAASVYFTLEETNECLCDNVSSKSSRTSSERPPSDKEAQRASPTASSSSGGQELTKFADEYEEGKAELVRIPRMQLRMLIQEKLRHDGIRLACQPYTTPHDAVERETTVDANSDGSGEKEEGTRCWGAESCTEELQEGERGYLEGLASRYADLFRTHYGDVLEPLEELRRRETNASPRMANTQLTTSHSQPIYVPGKYSPSSCLSDKEEDEIYGFGYGVFGRQMLQQRQQKLALATQNATTPAPGVHQQPNYQSCLSPRSAFFYEFPPNEQGQNTSKKKTTFSRLLRGLKTHRKEKQGQSQGSPRHARTTRMGAVPQRDTSFVESPTLGGGQRGANWQKRLVPLHKMSHLVQVDTPDSVLQSGLGLGPDMGHTILRSMVDPRDYDRLRYLQMNGGQPNSFEETIQRLKVQEALRKKERFHKEHEEILRDIRQGLMQLGRDGRGQLPGDDTYMYDEDARCGGAGGLGPGPGGQHWYDEPPYESDPEDFLMGASGGPVPTATIQNGRVCFTLNLRPENRGEGVISLRTAGDISLPRDRTRKAAMSTMRGLILPQGHNNPPTIIPLTHSRASRESGDYASSDVQSEASALLEGDGRAGIAGRARNLRHDVQRKISRLRQDRASSEAFPCSASSVESLPSGSGSSTQALVRAGSNHSSISCEDRDAVSPTAIGPVLCRARALVDYTPSPYDKDALKFKKGDVIDVVQMNTSGLWKGVVHNRVGHFKFINVEILNERVPRRGEPDRGKWSQRYRQKPGSVEELLQRMNLQEHISVFVLNGYEDLELFREVEPADLDYLGIHQPEHRTKILTAVQLLNDLQSGSEGDLASSSEGDEVSRLALTSGQTSGHCSPFGRRQFPRDSGCYDAHKNPTRRATSPEGKKLTRENNLDSSGQAKCPDNPALEAKEDFHPNIPITGGVPKETQFEKSPLLRGGNVRFIAKRGNFGETVVIEDANESGHKMSMVKYVVGGSSDLGLGCESGNATATLGQRGCLSEKSSDSGVSSSSLSSAPPPRDKALVAAAAADSPTKSFGNFSRGSPTSQGSGGKSQTAEGGYQ
ncbi:uncharacterized protein LOC105704408 isoform X2 [Orussus abietinus]|uniref:uncharacterized protein LOC105704408 isoform X2 n=1 Tax=Orussus abietinus TaxID=222816 RepID=UPI000625A105|nr:uncharacterized protein LOC105704408 isoform X2 [Orussus abietinus]